MVYSMENPNRKGMIPRGTMGYPHDLGNLHIYNYVRVPHIPIIMNQWGSEKPNFGHTNGITVLEKMRYIISDGYTHTHSYI